MISLKLEVPAAELVYDKSELRKILRAVGNELAAVTRALIRGAAGSGRTYTRGGRKYQASAPGQPPVSVTGALAASIGVTMSRSGESVTIGERIYYATPLQVGFTGGGRSGGKLSSVTKALASGRAQQRLSASRTVAPRPSLTLALDQRAGSIQARVEAAVQSGMRFQKLKP